MRFHGNTLCPVSFLKGLDEEQRGQAQGPISVNYRGGKNKQHQLCTFPVMLRRRQKKEINPNGKLETVRPFKFFQASPFDLNCAHVQSVEDAVLQLILRMNCSKILAMFRDENIQFIILSTVWLHLTVKLNPDFMCEKRRTKMKSWWFS